MIIKPNTNLKDLDIEEKLDLVYESNGYLSSILEGCEFDDLELCGLNDLHYLPEGIKIKNYLWLEDCENIRELPKNLNVGNVVLANLKNLTHIPEDIELKNTIFIRNCNNLKEMPKHVIERKLSEKQP